MNFYTSDLHLYHHSVLNLSCRPFMSVEEMHDILIDRWNRKVKKNDTVYILGDVGCPKKQSDVIHISELLKKFNGKKVLITGNHDGKLICYDEFVKQFESIHSYLELSDMHRNIILFHYPLEEWNHFFKNSIHLFGHVHNNERNLKKIKNRYNVGVDVNNFEPVSLVGILQRI